jgi:hypothetical protein
MSANELDDLWPADIAAPPESKAPLIILREQAALLARKTKNLVEAEVATRPDPDQMGALIMRFTLVAPALSDYRYDLFTAIQSASLYPVRINWQGQMFTADEEEGLKKYLRNIFASHTAKKIVGGLVAQSQA